MTTILVTATTISMYCYLSWLLFLFWVYWGGAGGEGRFGFERFGVSGLVGFWDCMLLQFSQASI